jgi:hypothetical protein
LPLGPGHCCPNAATRQTGANYTALPGLFGIDEQRAALGIRNNGVTAFQRRQRADGIQRALGMPKSAARKFNRQGAGPEYAAPQRRKLQGCVTQATRRRVLQKAVQQPVSGSTAPAEIEAHRHGKGFAQLDQA